MKKVFLLMVVPALLVALGFAQTPAASINIDPTSIKGCLSGTDGNYTVVEDNTGHIFKITTTSVSLNPHVGHEVTLTGNSTAGKGFAVTGLNMISEHCAAAAAAVPATTVSPSPETVSTPAPPAAPISTPADTSVKPAVAAAAAPSATVSTPSEPAIVPAVAAAAPAATVSTPADTAVIPAVGAAAPDTTVIAIPKTVSTPATVATAPTRTSPRSRKQSTKPTAAAAPAAAKTPAEPVNTPAAAYAKPDASASAATEPSVTPPIATKPAKAAWGGSVLLVAFVVVVLLIGAVAPLANRWRKRRILEKTGPQSLSINSEVISDQSKSEEPVVRKIA